MGPLRNLCLAVLVGVSTLAYAGSVALGGENAGKKAVASQASATTPAILLKHRAYTLAECLALADRNHPSLWAARARLGGYRAQLDEAHWAPFWLWNANSSIGIIPNIRGAAPYTSASSYALNSTFSDGFNPWFRIAIDGGIPLYTFGKIEWIGRAAEAQARAGEWEAEKFRQQVRMDVRKAYYGTMFARDARYLSNEILGRLDKAIEGVQAKLDKGERGIDEGDRLRLELYRDDLVAHSGETDKGETSAMSALRFMTGIQSDFDIPDEPLTRAEVPVAPVVSYLTAARLFRPEVNQARAGIAARRAQLEFARAKLFPDIALGFRAGYSFAQAAIIQNGWVSNPFNSNGFGFGGAVVGRWSLDIMPAQARIAAAESQLEEMRALQRLALGGIAVEVEIAYSTTVEARQREATWAHAEHRTKEWIASVQDAIDLGTKEESALMEPLRTFAGSRSSHISAMMDYNVALSDLARVSGWDEAAPVK